MAKFVYNYAAQSFVVVTIPDGLTTLFEAVSSDCRDPSESTLASVV